mgnify:CR=1 FL=1
MMSEQGLAGPTLHFAPKIKNIIFCFMPGGVSHIDTFDPKPKLEALHGKTFDGFYQVGAKQETNRKKFLERELRAPNGAFFAALDADSPDHSSLSYIRNRLPLEVHQQVFVWILALANEKKTVAAAASKALPPFSSTAMPTWPSASRSSPP